MPDDHDLRELDKAIDRLRAGYRKPMPSGPRRQPDQEDGAPTGTPKSVSSILRRG